MLSVDALLKLRTSTLQHIRRRCVLSSLVHEQRAESLPSGLERDGCVAWIRHHEYLLTRIIGVVVRELGLVLLAGHIRGECVAIHIRHGARGSSLALGSLVVLADLDLLALLQVLHLRVLLRQRQHRRRHHTAADTTDTTTASMRRRRTAKKLIADVDDVVDLVPRLEQLRLHPAEGPCDRRRTRSRRLRTGLGLREGSSLGFAGMLLKGLVLVHLVHAHEELLQGAQRPVRGGEADRHEQQQMSGVDKRAHRANAHALISLVHSFVLTSSSPPGGWPMRPRSRCS